MTLRVAPPPRSLPDPGPDERTLAMFCHLSVVFGSIVVPGLIYIFKRESSPFVAFHATQALVFQISSFVLALVVLCASFGFAGFVVIVPMIMGVMRALKANQGEWKGYPVIGHLGLPE
jgi:uncharacterized Tic20 family protein